MTKRTNPNTIVGLIYLLVGLLGLAALLFSCSAVKRVNKSEEKQLKVIENYSKKHPAKNDTVTVFKPGDTVTNVTERLDTLYLETLPDTVLNTKYKYITKTVTVTKTVKDTILRNVIDRSKEAALQNIINGKDNVIIDLKAAYQEMKYNRDRWRLWFFVSLLINTLFLYFRIRKLFL